MEKIRVGIVGCGRISNQYLTNFTTWFPSTVSLVAAADLNAEAAASVAREFSVERPCTPEELYAMDDVDVVLNLTNPWAHTDVNLAAIASGKHVYTEKPLALERDGAVRVLEAARTAGLRVGCAPDTFLGAGIQTCIKLVDEGWIGTPSVAHASITMGGVGMSARYQSAGIGGVLMDMAPYYVTALVAMFGPIARVAGLARISAGERLISDMRRPDYGETIGIESPTSVVGSLEHASGVFATLTATVDSHTYGPSLRVIGTEGVLTCNDPNMFGGAVVVERKGQEARQMPLTHQFDDRNRGLGLVEMAFAADADRPHRASGELGLHVVDVLLGLKASSEDGRYCVLEPVCDRPEPFRPGHSESPLLEVS